MADPWQVREAADDAHRSEGRRHPQAEDHGGALQQVPAVPGREPGGHPRQRLQPRHRDPPPALRHAGVGAGDGTDGGATVELFLEMHCTKADLQIHASKYSDFIKALAQFLGVSEPNARMAATKAGIMSKGAGKFKAAVSKEGAWKLNADAFVS